MSTTKKFQKEYDRLNTGQRLAVDTIDGPVMVIAGPGTGKTQILTLRIANIIKETDTEPENILALTFTEAAVNNMRKRLLEMIGNDAYSVRISTFHGFANDLIQNNPEAFPHIIGSTPITQVDQIALIESIIMDTDELELLKPFGDTFYYVRSIQNAVSKLKREGVDPGEFARIVRRAEKDFESIDDLYYESGAHKGKMRGKYQKEHKTIAKNKELAMIYLEYQRRLRENKSYDFADMIMETVQVLGNNDQLLLSLQEEYQYILVDEHQDTNNAQNRILELLANFHDHPNIFVVGDEKQSIFRFQGASLENFYYFKHLYPDATLITLEENYRSTQNILDSAFSLITSEKNLHANVEYEGKKIHTYGLPNHQCELFFVARDIKTRIEEDGITPSHIAVLYRDNRDAFPLAKMLEKFGVPFVIESDQDIFADKNIEGLVMLLQSLRDFGNDEALSKVLLLPLFDIDTLDAHKLIRAASSRRVYTLYDLVKSKELRKGLKIDDNNKIAEFYTKLTSWEKRFRATDVLSALEEIVRESGLLSRVIRAEHAEDHLDALNGFFDEVRSLQANHAAATLDDVLNYFDTVSKHKVSVKKKKRSHRKSAVRLMTAHRSKGLEFDYVYIIHANDGHFGNSTRRELLPLLPGVFQMVEDPEKSAVLSDDFNSPDADERRLFYVALTRAKQHVVISYHEERDDGREQLPSPFLAEIDPDLVDMMDTSEIIESFTEGEWFVTVDETKGTSDDRERYQEFVREQFLKQGLSPTALNNYLRSPWQYFYRNLVRIPSAPSKSQGYGIAVHAALHDLFQALRYGDEAGKEYFVESFVRSLDNQYYLNQQEYDEALSKGKVALPNWYDEYSEAWNTNTMNEFRLNGIHLSDEIRLTGVIDKMEFLSDDEVRVIDYKTGRTKTRGQIQGTTKDSEGDFYRQLVFYKLLLRYFKDGKYTMISGIIDFIEPDTKGKYRKEEFEITEEEVDELEETIRRVADEIMNFSFWDEPCEPEKCDYCDLVEAIRS